MTPLYGGSFCINERKSPGAYFEEGQSLLHANRRIFMLILPLIGIRSYF